MHKPSDQVAADGHVAYNNNNEEENNDNKDKRHFDPPNHQCESAMTSVWEKQRKSKAADAQIWRWKSHNERVLHPRYTKQPELGYTESVCAATIPAQCHEPGEIPKKQRAQNRAAQRAFRARQKRTFRDLEVRNRELTDSLDEALEEINGLRSFVNSTFLEMKTHRGGTSSAVNPATQQYICSVKCRSKVMSVEANGSPTRHLFRKGKNTRSSENGRNAPQPQIHTNACLFQSTATTTIDRYTAQFSSASNEAVATMQSAKQICINSGTASSRSIPNCENSRAKRQAHILELVPWLSIDATLSADQVDAYAGCRSLSGLSIQETEPFCANLMDCSSCSSSPHEYHWCSTGSSTFASTSAIDDDNLDTPSTSPDSNGNMVQFGTDAPQCLSPSTNINDSSGLFSAPFEGAAGPDSELKIPSCFGLGEVDWYEAPY
jgi:hypothetical protein